LSGSLERDRYVIEACAGDEELQREVGRLLERDDTRNEQFLEHPLAIGDETGSERLGGSSPQTLEELPATIGPFRVKELLGQGDAPGAR
jgi:hypothetical protein